MAKQKQGKKFKTIEKEAKDAPVKDIQWEGEEITTESTTKIEMDQGTGQAIVLRFFDFGANPEVFRHQKPTAQQLFNEHMRGMESLLWRDGLRPYEAVEPRLMFSKDKTHYRFVIACLPKEALIDQTRTLSQLLTNSKS